MTTKKQTSKRRAQKRSSKEIAQPPAGPLGCNIQEDQVVFEAVLQSEHGRSMFATNAALRAENLDQFRPHEGQGMRAARILRELGFTVRHIGTFSISAQGPPKLWEKVFGTKVERKTQKLSEAHPELGEVKYWSGIPQAQPGVPETLKGLVERAYPQRPPVFFGESPLPPRVGYHHLRCRLILQPFCVRRSSIVRVLPETAFWSPCRTPGSTNTPSILGMVTTTTPLFRRMQSTWITTR